MWRCAALPLWAICSAFPGSILQWSCCCLTAVLYHRCSSSSQHLLGGFTHRMFVQIMDKHSSFRNMGFTSVENQVLNFTLTLFRWCWVEAVRAIRWARAAFQEGSAARSPDPIFYFLFGFFGFAALMGNLPLKEKGRETSRKGVSSVSSPWCHTWQWCCTNMDRYCNVL